MGCSKPGRGINGAAKHTQHLREPVSSAVIFAVQNRQKAGACSSIPLPGGAIRAFQEIHTRLHGPGFPGAQQEPETEFDLVNELEGFLLDKHGVISSITGASAGHPSVSMVCI